MDRKLVPHHSHWGAFSAVVEDGKLVDAVPFALDPDPSPLIEAIPDAVHSPTRIARPMVPAGLFGGADSKKTQVGKGGCAWHGTRGAFAALAQAGVRVVNISPIREDGPEAVRPDWIPIRPNTDAAMMLAMAHTLVAEGHHNEAFLARYCSGFPRVLPYLTGEADGQPKDAA